VDSILVTDLRRIARTYMRGWFGLDFLASFPFDNIIIAIVQVTPPSLWNLKSIKHRTKKT
jgi:hypothetical protein